MYLDYRPETRYNNQSPEKNNFHEFLYKLKLVAQKYISVHLPHCLGGALSPLASPAPAHPNKHPNSDGGGYSTTLSKRNITGPVVSYLNYAYRLYQRSTTTTTSHSSSASLAVVLWV